MTKVLYRTSAVLIAFALIAFAMIAVVPPVLQASAASGDKPAFEITTDRESASTGSQIMVAVAVDNDTTNVITSFAGELRFDTRFFRYDGYEDQISMDGSVDIVADSASNGKLSFVYTGKELTNSRINSGDSVVFIKFRFTVVTPYDTTGQFFIGTINDCYYGTENIGIIDCKAPGVTVRSTTVPLQTQSTTAPAQLSGDARLSALVVEGCKLSPDFNAEFVAYSATVPYETSSVRIDAVTSASAAIASGLGVKDLSVGINNFTVTVLAENGTTKEYGIIIIRQEQAVSEATTTTTSATTAAPTEAVTTTTTFADTLPTTVNPGSTTIGSDEESRSDDILQVVGIVFGEIALFFFGFLSGFFVDKNLRRKGERLEEDDYDDYDDEDDYDRPENIIYAPSDALYPDGTYVDPGYQQAPQYAEPPLVDPQLLQYNQFMQQSMGAEQNMPYPQGTQMPQQNMPMVNPAEQQMGQFGEQPMYPADESYNNGYTGPYYG